MTEPTFPEIRDYIEQIRPAGCNACGQERPLAGPQYHPGRLVGHLMIRARYAFFCRACGYLRYFPTLHEERWREHKAAQDAAKKPWYRFW